MNSRQNFSSGAQWEDVVGYSRLVKVENLLFVAGTTGRGADVEAQTRSAMEIIKGALERAGASLDDVVRTRMFVKNIKRDNEIVGRLHREYFGAARPVATMVEVSAFIADELLIEIEVDAVIGVSRETGGRGNARTSKL